MAPARIELRDIVTEADRAAVIALRANPARSFMGSVASSFRDAAEDPDGKPRMWSIHATEGLVGFVMLSDGVDVIDDVHPYRYFLWRLLIDERFQNRGYGSATIEAVVAYLRDRPGADTLFTSTEDAPGTPIPFYERNGFRRTGEIRWDEVILRRDLVPGPDAGP